MRKRRLVAHFLDQFVDNDWSPDVDRHQMLALVAAGVITIPLFATVMMGLRYLMQPMQAAGWTETAGLEDQIVFCATSMLVAAIVAALQWDGLALTLRDSFILGVLPIQRRDIVRAKLLALGIFVAAFVVALNALPTLIHPPLMVATLPVSLFVIPVLMLAHALATTMAAAFGFACAVGLRELLQLSLAPFGQRTFLRVSGSVRSVVLLALLVLVALAPARLAGRADWMFPPEQPSLLLRPVGWFAGAHAAIVGRVLRHVPDRDLRPAMSNDEQRLRARFEGNIPHFTMLALQGAAALLAVVGLSLTTYLWNARRLHLLMDEGRAAPVLGVARAAERMARATIRRPATRAGMMFLVRTMARSAVHHLYLLVSLAAGWALLLTTLPHATGAVQPPLRTLHVAAQTLALTALIAGYRAAIRTAADERAAWLFAVADTGYLRQFRTGVRVGAIAAIAGVVVLLFPLHTVAWGPSIAVAHAVNGLAVGWLLVETVSVTVERPLVATIPPNDGLNTVGAVFLGATVIGVFALARIELTAMRGGSGMVVFPVLLMLSAGCLRYIGERQHRAAAIALALANASSGEQTYHPSRA